MQNRYVGDIGDFAKYALLRSISRGSPNALRLAVIWYLYPDEVHNSDGRHVRYLSSEAYRVLDAELHAAMSRLVRRGKRSVAEVRKAAVLPSGTVFFEEPIVGKLGSDAPSDGREAFRTKWFHRAQSAVVEADIVFLDPDNGIEVRSVPKHAPKAGKYVFWDELRPFWDRGQSLVVYHHLNRSASIQEQTKALRKKFRDIFSDAGEILSLLFRRGSCRHFWIVSQAPHARVLRTRVEGMMASGWDGHFEVR